MPRGSFIYQFIILIAIVLFGPAVAADDNSDDILTAINIVRYELDITVDYDNESYFTSSLITFHNTSSQAFDRIPLLLYRLLSVTTIHDDAGNIVEFTQSVKSFEDWGKLQVNSIEIVLDEPLGPGEKKTLEIKYEGHMLGYTEVGMLYLKDKISKDFTILRMDTYAYPRIGGLSRKANRAAGLPEFDYLIRVTVPENLVVANGGQLESKTTHDSMVTYIYSNIKPAWRMDIAISNYMVLTSGAHKVFCFPKDEEGGRNVLRQMEKTLKLYTSWFGPLKSDSGFTVIEIPDTWGSQADVSSIIQSAAVFTDPKQVDELYHEVSHLWNPRSNDTIPCRMESEGLATFLQALLLEELDQREGVLIKYYDWATKSFAESCDRSSANRDIPIRQYGEKDITGLSYSKGMLFFGVLYEITGPDRFKEIVRNYYQTFAANGATLDDFLQIIRKGAEFDADRFIEDWIDGANSSQYILDGLSVPEMAAKYRR